jgi:DNA-binding response OmpR family regulator
MILVYKDYMLAFSYTIEDIKDYLNRRMFKNMTKAELNNLYIDTEYYSIDSKDKYSLNIINGLTISNIEYNILDILYSNNREINSKYNLYQFIYTHNLINIDNIDEYIKYRDRLENICYLDNEYRTIVHSNRTLY